ncbi:NfeD family protein [Alistipes dispar]|uniref:NfeD family protein n=1 Tax=Alistipes dispar TaxID=2585119 RepID=UPI002FDE7FBA
MELFYIILLIFFGLLFLVAELVLLPGVTVGAALALLCDGCAVWLAFRDFGTGGGAAAIVAVLLLSLLVTVVSLRAKTWQRFSLRQQIRSSSTPVSPAEELHIGDRGTTLSRLSPMGRIEIGGRAYEAKSAVGYVDPQREVEVVGFENFSVVVKIVKQ